jgi:hypothetical protein
MTDANDNEFKSVKSMSNYVHYNIRIHIGVRYDKTGFLFILRPADMLLASEFAKHIHGDLPRLAGRRPGSHVQF